jgi:diguanylate cyclase (GGDEF)-like protein/PAS domain S-box-containing protein
VALRLRALTQTGSRPSSETEGQLLARSWWWFAVSVALFVAIFLLRLVLDKPGWGVSLLFDLPVALIAVAFGVRAGLVAATLGLFLFALTDVIDPIRVNGVAVHTNAAGYVSRAVGLYLLGALLGLYSDRVRRGEERGSRLAAIVESSDDAILGQDLEGTILSWNGGAERLYGYTADEMVGRHISVLIPKDRVAELRDVLGSIERGENFRRLETMRLTKAGEKVEVSVTVSPVRDKAGALIGASAIARDITDRKQMESRLKFLVDHDPVTTLHNRRRFEEELAREVSYAARYGNQGAALILDLDNFKYINDNLGHSGGDEVLRGVGTLLRERLRDGDLLARLGGDEFAVILPQISEQDARSLANELRDRLRQHPFFVGGKRLIVSASVGVALFEEGLDAGDLLVNADLAMYEAKEAGRDQVAIYSATQGRTARLEVRLSWMDRIRTALQEESFTLYSQPILDLATSEVSQQEILLRMTDRDGGPLLPGAFLGPAERFGLIQEIDRWVVREAIRAVGSNGSGMPIEINISARSIGDHNLITEIDRGLNETGADPERLIFEITESSAISNMEEARTFAKTLRILGCRFALDDFGAGFGSFFYLKYLPLDYIKIDGDFIRELTHNSTDQVLVKAIVQVAEGLGMQTIAEAVENQQTLDLLNEYGVDYAQGFHIGRPKPLPDIRAAVPA